MQRIAKSGLTVGILLVFAATLTGCASNTSSATDTSTATTTTVNMTDPTAVAALCGTPAGDGSADKASAAFNELVASEDSGHRNQTFKAWGVNPQDKKAIAAATDALKTRVAVTCKDVAAGDATVGVQNADGSVQKLPLIAEGTDTIVMDTTAVAATPPLIQPNLLDVKLRYTAQTLTWAGLVERVGDKQWYIDGVNARAAQTGFTWDDVLKFASVNKVVSGKVAGSNALAIQVFNRPDLDNEAGRAQVRDEVRKYITPDVETTIGITVNELPMQFIGKFTNTRNVGTFGSPKMGDYIDPEKMIRVSLMPITFDANGKPVSLDGNRGAGVFIDCGNLHWVPQAIWTCTDTTCTKPTPPPTTPPAVCQWDHSLPPNSPKCLQPKDWNKSPNNGWTPLTVGPLTDGKQSQNQQASGDTRGNVTDNPVPAGTTSGATTPDLPTGTVVAPGATTGGDNRSNDTVDPTVTNQNPGGTTGDTCIADPDTGVSNCK